MRIRIQTIYDNYDWRLIQDTRMTKIVCTRTGTFLSTYICTYVWKVGTVPTYAPLSL
jgi:hypothetical protein